MASLILHQIIGEKYCELNHIDNRQQFLSGNISPDILPNKDLHHYKEPKPCFSYLDVIEDRVNLSAFCQKNSIVDAYNLGYFLHLVTDYIFYNKLIIDNPSHKDLCNAKHTESSKKMYKEYDRIAHYLQRIFPNTDISKLPHNATTTLNEKLQILKEDELLKFISICSHINLVELYKRISYNDYSTLSEINFNF